MEETSTEVFRLSMLLSASVTPFRVNGNISPSRLSSSAAYSVMRQPVLHVSIATFANISAFVLGLRRRAVTKKRLVFPPFMNSSVPVRRVTPSASQLDFLAG